MTQPRVPDGDPTRIKTPTQPVPPPTRPGANPPAGGYERGNAPTKNPDGWEDDPKTKEPEE